MATFYLMLAMVLAVTLSHPNRWVRAAGTLVAALSLTMIVVSIVLAHLDGTFAAVSVRAGTLLPSKPAMLTTQALVASIAAAFLYWAAWAQTQRLTVAPPLGNTATSFGIISRYAHWMTAILMFCLIPIGLFMTVLPVSSPDRAEFIATHQSLGLTLPILVLVRLLWLAVSPPPAHLANGPAWERHAARAVHAGLYLLILAFPLSGFLLTAYRGEAVQFYGLPVSGLVTPSDAAATIWAGVHNLVLPVAFYALIFGHIGAVVKRHAIDRRRDDIRHMLT
jgi:cytochrome b561